MKTKIYTERYKWAENERIVDMKMNGPDVVPFVVTNEPKKKKKRTMSKMVQDRRSEMSQFA